MKHADAAASRPLSAILAEHRARPGDRARNYKPALVLPNGRCHSLTFPLKRGADTRVVTFFLAGGRSVERRDRAAGRKQFEIDARLALSHAAGVCPHRPRWLALSHC